LDFTIKSYTRLLGVLRVRGYFFQTVESFIKAPKDKTIILRHDVDRIPDNALKLAKLEHELGIGSTYYFRAVQESWNENIIREIASIGHEIGYHYENLTMCKGDMEQAFVDFKSNLAKLRKIAPVSTICMHGSPLSKWDNRDLWKKYNYRDFGIIGEPYFDVDFSDVFYLTDTGRRWDGARVSVRDKVNRQTTEDGRQRTEDGGRRTPQLNRTTATFNGVKRPGRGHKVQTFQKLKFHSTFEIIRAAEQGNLPDKIMINTHPQRWDDRFGPWVKELVWQNVKNVIKRYVIKFRK